MEDYDKEFPETFYIIDEDKYKSIIASVIPRNVGWEGYEIHKIVKSKYLSSHYYEYNPEYISIGYGKMNYDVMHHVYFEMSYACVYDNGDIVAWTSIFDRYPNVLKMLLHQRAIKYAPNK